MLITKNVMVKWNPANKKWYEEKGYTWTKQRDQFECKIEDLTQKGKEASVNVICDNELCTNKNQYISYKNYIKNTEKHEGKYICYNCLRSGLYKYDVNNHLVTKNDKGQRICNLDGCNNVHHAQGYCEYHNRHLTKGKTCIVEGCNEKHFSKGYCKNHYYINKRFGFIPNRNREDELEIKHHASYAEVTLYDINYMPRAYTQISLEDVEKVKHYKWRLGSNGYVCGWVNEKTVSLHRFLLDAPKGKVVHHKNHIITDNRKNNLLICTQLENSFDKIDIEQYNSSGYVGVFYNRKNTIHPWVAFLSEKIMRQIKNNGGCIGSFKTYEEAVYHREIYELYYYKEFSPRFSILKEKHKDIYNDIVENGIEKYITS